jgi:ElaB/YqjD/DUF883 family membrane-anchored ribosome-binding protein
MRARWNNEDFRRDVDAIRSDVHQLKTDLVSAMHDLISASREGVTEAREVLQDQVQEKLDALNDATAEFSRYGRQAAHKVREQVEEHPARTALIVLGIAAIVGMLFMGGSRRRF